MILTKQIKIQKTNNLNSKYVESELNKLGILPLRWAIVKIDSEFYYVSASFEQKNKNN